MNISLLKGERGFGLLEAIIAAAMLSIVSLGLMTVMAKSQGTQNNILFRNDATNLVGEIRALLGSQASCMANFVGKGIVLNPQTHYTPTSLVDSTGTTQYSTGGLYGTNQSIQLKSLDLSQYQAGTTARTGMMVLTIIMNANREGLGTSSVPRIINISLATDASNNITSCVALSQMANGIWQMQANSPNNIYYIPNPTLPNGFVGISTATPTVALDVNGGIRSGSSTINMPCGMGQAAGEGTTRYNYTLHHQEICNGTTWVSPGATCTPRTAQGTSGWASTATQYCQPGENVAGGTGGCGSGVARIASMNSYAVANGWRTDCEYEQNSFNNGYVTSTAYTTVFCCQ